MRPQAITPRAVTYYRDAEFLVTSAKVKSPRKTYRIDKIEKVSIRRDPYFISLAFSILIFLFLMRFGWLFFSPIPFVVLWLAIVATYTTKQISMLFITSKAISEFAFIGLNDRLERVRDGIEQAMLREDRDDGLGGDGSRASEADEADSDDE